MGKSVMISGPQAGPARLSALVNTDRAFPPQLERCNTNWRRETLLLFECPHCIVTFTGMGDNAAQCETSSLKDAADDQLGIVV